MYIVRTKHLEQVRKALENSNKVLESIQKTSGNLGTKKAIAENDKAIALINEEYLEIKND